MIKRFKDYTLRVIIWGRNEYSGGLQCKAVNDPQELYFKDGKLFFDCPFNPNESFRFFKGGMSRQYVFDLNGKCLSHSPPPRNWNKGKCIGETFGL